MNQLGKFDILLVEDSPSDAKIFQECLSDVSARVQIYWVASGQEALEFLHQQGRFVDVGPVKLVVMDLNMPGLDGIETLRRIKMDPVISRVPVVLLSSTRAPEEVDLAYSLGANAFISKPLSLEGYVQKTRVLVHHWLDCAELPTPIYQRDENRSGSRLEQAHDHLA